ncbi:hypothetical protein JG688_00015153 [Phytophthora aleatoria]|uniref:Uncharacterized protein n=1 Tax=Phytophthora aleatoria TaxID=2496075 RepID=A0A8J5MDK2_9STRA|nr:hypothetical protein JG688_00015153 [Phytophthora aleatoria]
MSSLTKTPAQGSASADTATSVPASTGNTTSVPAQASTVGEYHALQYKKHALGDTDAPKAITEGSSVCNSNGSMPTEYGSDISDVPSDVSMEDEAVAATHDPLTRSRRPREEDPNASSSKRSCDEEEENAPVLVTPSSPRSVAT